MGGSQQGLKLHSQPREMLMSVEHTTCKALAIDSLTHSVSKNYVAFCPRLITLGGANPKSSIPKPVGDYPSVGYSTSGYPTARSSHERICPCALEQI